MAPRPPNGDALPLACLLSLLLPRVLQAKQTSGAVFWVDGAQWLVFAQMGYSMREQNGQRAVQV